MQRHFLPVTFAEGEELQPRVSDGQEDPDERGGAVSLRLTPAPPVALPGQGHFYS